MGGDVRAGGLREVPFVDVLVPVAADEGGLEEGAAEGVAVVEGVGGHAGEVGGWGLDEGGERVRLRREKGREMEKLAVGERERRKVKFREAGEVVMEW